MARTVFATAFLLAMCTSVMRAADVAWDIAIASSTATTVSTLDINQDYLLRIRLKNTQSNTWCEQCGRELSSIGGYPLVYISDDVPIAMLVNQSTWINALQSNVSEWLVPITIIDYGSIIGEVSSNATMPPYLLQADLDTLSFILSVSPFSYDAQGALQIYMSDTSASISVSLSASSTTFEIFDMPNFSTGSIGVVNSLIGQPSANASNVLLSQFLYSEDDWETTLTITVPNQVTHSLNNICHPGNVVIVRQMLLLQESALLLTDGGVLLGQMSNQQMTYTNLLAQCVSAIQYTRQTDIKTKLCGRVFLLGSPGTTDSGRIWTVRPDTPTIITELLDIANQTLPLALGLSGNNIALIGADMSFTDCSSYYMLVHIISNNTYMLTSYNVNTQTWLRDYTVPLSVPAGAQLNAIPLYDGINPLLRSSSGSTPLTPIINGVTFPRQISDDVFLYGNVLLYSPASGQGMVMLKAFTDGSIITSLVFPTAKSDTSYLVYTSKSEIYYGELGSSTLFLIQSATTTLPVTTTYPVFFDRLNALYELTVVVGTSGAQVTRSLLPLDMRLAIQLQQAKVPCPYSLLEIEASHDQVITRSPRIEDAALPSSIHLDRGDSYTFTVSLTPSFYVDLDDLILSVRLSDQHYLEVSSKRQVYEYKQEVVYTITVLDTQRLGYQMRPTDTPIATNLYLYVQNGYQCKDPKKKGLSKNTFSRTLTVYTGCPPYQKMNLNLSVPAVTECETTDPNIPCVFYEKDYEPYYSLQDLLNSVNVLYEGFYTLSLVGGGLTQQTVVEYTVDQINTLNKITWGAVNDVPKYTLNRVVFTWQTNLISWICGSGSPCAAVIPKIPDTAAYFFLIEMSTGGVSANDTYCNLTQRYLLRLNGLQVDFTTSFTATMVTALVTMGMVFSLAIYNYHKQRKEMLIITPYKLKGDNERKPLLNKNKIYPTATAMITSTYNDDNDQQQEQQQQKGEQSQQQSLISQTPLPELMWPPVARSFSSLERKRLFDETSNQSAQLPLLRGRMPLQTKEIPEEEKFL